MSNGERVVLGHREKSGMTKFRWSGKEPQGLNDPETAEELGAKWEGDDLVIDDYQGFIELYEYYERGEYLPDND